MRRVLVAVSVFAVSLSAVAVIRATPADPTTAAPAAPKLTGRVVDGDQAAVANASVLVFANTPLAKPVDGASPIEQTPVATALTDDEGRFEVEVTADELRLSMVVRAPGFETHYNPKLAADDSPTVTLAVGATVRGTVSTPGRDATAPLAGAAIEITKPPRAESPAVPARPAAHPPAITRLLYPIATANAAGEWSIDGYAPGLYKIRVRAPGHREYVDDKLKLTAGRSVQLDTLLIPSATIRGTVRAANGDPVADARVYFKLNRLDPADRDMFRRGPPNDLTDREGKFVLEGLPPEGDGVLHVSHPKFSAYEEPRAAGAVGTTVTIAVELSAGARVSGRLVDQYDQPVAAAIVFLAPVETEAGTDAARRTREPRPPRPTAEGEKPAGTTADDGAFVIPFAKAGAGRVHVWAGGRVVPTDLALTVEPGKELVDQLVRVSLGESLTGRVVDAANQPIAGAHVAARSRTDRSGHASMRADDDGRFALRGVGGEHCELSVSHPDYAERDPESVSCTAHDLVIVLQAYGVVTGRVTLDDGAVPGAVRIDFRDATPAASSLGPMGGDDAESVETDATGTYQARAEPGTWDVLLDSPGYLQTIVAAVEVRSGETTTGVDATLQRGRSLTGTVRRAGDGEPVHGANVEVQTGLGPRMPFEQPTHKAMTDATGRFRLEGLHSGPVALLIRHLQYPRTTVTADVPASGPAAHIEITVSTGGVLEGYVLGHGDTPIVGAWVGARRLGDLERPERVSTDVAGYYRIEGLGPGEVYVDLEPPANDSRGRRSASASIRDGATTRLDFSYAGADLVGRVLRRGEPIAGAHIDVHRQAETPGAGNFGSAQTESDSDGRYAFVGLAAGTYGVRVRVDVRSLGSTTAVSLPPVTIPASGQIEIDLVLDSGIRVTGTVVDDAGEPVAGAQLFLHGTDPNGTGARRSVARATSDPDGNFELSAAGPGDYQLLTAAERFPMPASINLVIDPTTRPEPLRIVLGGGRSLLVQVTDVTGRPIAEAMVVALSARSSPNFPTTADHVGRARLAIGNDDDELSLMVLARGYAPRITGPVALDGREQTVTLERGGTLRIQLPTDTESQRAAKLTVVDQNGIDYGGRLLGYGRSFGLHDDAPETDGELTFTLPVGTYTIGVTSGERSGTGVAVVVAGQLTTVAIPF